MGIDAIFEPENWNLPFHFWSVVFFIVGAMVGSFLNVCIHRMPLDQSVISPPSHCPKCKYSIPWYLNMPLITWLWLRGKCAHCGERISIRYFLVELLTGLAFLASWLAVGAFSPWVAAVYCLILAGFIVATFIDFEHFIIPDEITLGGIVVGFLCSIIVPAMHHATTVVEAMKSSFWGIVVGGGALYLVLRGGKLLFGRHKVDLPDNSRIVFTETALVLPDETIPYEEIFYRKSDTIQLEARHLELIDRCCWSVPIRLSPERLSIAGETMDPENVPHMEVLTDGIVLPREAMGLGDVKFVAAIGAFLGWKATVFTLLCSSVIGGVIGVGLIAMRRREWSSRLPFGPYLVAGAVLWMFGGEALFEWWLSGAFADPYGY